jgi:hypothetical protein
MPSIENLLIIIESSSSISNSNWQQIIDLEKVYSALSYLKQINKHYKNILIDKNINSKLFETIFHKLHTNETVNEYKNLYEENLNDEIDSSKLENKILTTNIEYDETISVKSIKQFSLDQLHHNISENTDIDKYCQIKNYNEPIKDRDPNMDHLCFPIIFSRGNFN